MVGPEFFKKKYLDEKIKWSLVISLFSYSSFHLFLRTPELANSWKATLPEFSDRIDFLPSLELHSETQEVYSFKPGLKKFLIAGQIREQKSIKSLVKLFSHSNNLGQLRIAGKFIEAELKSSVQKYFHDNISVSDNFLTESEMIQEFLSAHYNLMLYHPWDDRMESSMLFLSLKCCVPVIAFEGGWLGDRVIDEGIGWTIPRTEKEQIDEFLQSLPIQDSEEYQKVIHNMKSCYVRWTSSEVIDLFLQKLGWDN
jgi:glycosyltransferase involved in cell wall biosynthesis